LKLHISETRAAGGAIFPPRRPSIDENEKRISRAAAASPFRADRRASRIFTRAGKRGRPSSARNAETNRRSPIFPISEPSKIPPLCLISAWGCRFLAEAGAPWYASTARNLLAGVAAENGGVHRVTPVTGESETPLRLAGRGTKGEPLSKTEPRLAVCVTVVLEFRCSQQRDSLSSNGRTLLNIPVDDKVPSAALSPPLVFEGQRDSLRGLPGDCNNIFRARRRTKDATTNERAVSSRAALRDVVARHARGRNDMRLNRRLPDVSKRNLFYTG